jgi:DNA-binding FadR family transcriptional regulator
MSRELPALIEKARKLNAGEHFAALLDAIEANDQVLLPEEIRRHLVFSLETAAVDESGRANKSEAHLSRIEVLECFFRENCEDLTS